MRRFVVNCLQFGTLGIMFLLAQFAAAAEPATATTKITAASPAGGSVTSAKPNAAAGARVQSARRYSYARNGRSSSRTRSTGRGQYSYNYSGVGFPGMEGGLTAAANRSTWLKPMNTGRRGR